MENIERILQMILFYLVGKDLLTPIIEGCLKGFQEIKRKRVMRDTLRKNLQKMEGPEDENEIQ